VAPVQEDEPFLSSKRRRNAEAKNDYAGEGQEQFLAMLCLQKVQPILSSKRRPYSRTHKWSWKEQKYGHGSRRSAKPRIIVLARTINTSCSRASRAKIELVNKDREYS
jgi:hypothetical protein